MSDLFHENVTDEMLDRIFAVMAEAPQHTFQVLTKRPERMLEYFRMLLEEKDIQRWINAAYDSVPHLSPCAAGMMEDLDFPLPNVWLAVSVENRKAKSRMDVLRGVPAAIRFLSIEPLLEDLGNVDLAGIHWVICGGESGPNARPMHPDWANILRYQCNRANVPFFFKQWGEWEPSFQFDEQFTDVSPDTRVAHLAFDGHIGHSLAEMEGHPRHGLIVRTGKKRAGRMLAGREWNEFPEGRA